MLTTSLPLLPPPSTSLLPQFQNLHNDPANPQHHLHHPHNHGHRRHKHTTNPRSTLALLSSDERTIEARKLAIAMYGYSWLKPAGCNKTMLGRREEEVEREEVERQLREVEMQERVTQEAEDEARRERLMEQGEMVNEGERDLDDDVPEAEEDMGEEEQEGDDGEGGDLDDEVPDAEPFIYDSRRKPDTDEEEEEQLANEMLGEDELGEMDMGRDLDAEEEVRDMDDSQQRDMDDDVPEAVDEDEGEWQHTDTELEDSEMDISLLPGQGQHTIRRSMAGGQRSSMDAPGIDTRSSVRRVSGNAAQQIFQARDARSRAADQETPVNMESEMSFGLSSGPVDSEASRAAGTNTRRPWLGGTSARRNLFGGGRTAGGLTGGLFTPVGLTTRHADQTQGQDSDRGNTNVFETPEQQEQTQMSPRRSGRLLDAMRRRGRRNDDRSSLD